MPEELKEASLDQYVLCDTCSKEEGHKVYWHKKKGLRKVSMFLSDPYFTCPHGHRVTLDGSA